MKDSGQPHDAGHVQPKDAGSGRDASKAQDAGSTATRDAGNGSGACKSADDCTLIANGCCSACEPKQTDVVAVPVAERAATMMHICPTQPACGPCPVSQYDPLRAVLRADCVDQKCVVTDVREASQSACDEDSQCKLFGNGCCGGCGPDPRAYLALSADVDSFAAQSTGLCTAMCAACTDSLKPEAFCAADHHCAVREIPRVNGESSSTCFSPAQNLEHAYDTGAVGCDCYQPGAVLCIADSTGRIVALDCPATGPWHYGGSCHDAN